MSKLLSLKEERGHLTTEIRKAMEGNDETALKELETKFDTLNGKILAEERQLERERLNGEVEKKVEERKVEKSIEEKRSDAFKKFITSGNGAEYRDIQLHNATQAGFLVAPMQFSNEIIKGVDNDLILRQLATKYVLNGAHSLGFAKRDARVSSAAWGVEIAQPTADTSLAYGRREFKPNFASGLVKVSKELLRNAPNVEGEVQKEIAYEVGVLLEQAYMEGDGIGRPLGLFTANADGISTSRDVSTGNTTTSITVDGLKNAKYSLLPQYMNSGNLRWLFHRDAILQISKLKDGNGNYLWQESIVEGEPSRLLGVPVIMSEYVPNTFTTGLYVGMIGDFSQYRIVDSASLELQVLNELYAATNQVGYMYRIATDGAPALEEAFARVKLA
jgi:HK97 family phage major capsid protein